MLSLFIILSLICAMFEVQPPFPITQAWNFNSLSRRCECDFKCVNFKHDSGIDMSIEVPSSV